MKDLIKTNKWLVVSLVFLFIFLVMVIVLLSTTVSKDEFIVVSKALETKKNEYNNLKSEYDKSLKDKEEKIIELSQKEKQDEINGNIKLLENKIIELTSNKNSIESEIKKLKEDVIKIKGEAKTYPAGHLTAGIDIPVGRYKIFGGNSNFFVYSSYGNLKVNIILGNEYGVDEYLYTFKDGDKIESNSPFKLIEIE